jgi:hypothetical protein
MVRESFKIFVLNKKDVYDKEFQDKGIDPWKEEVNAFVDKILNDKDDIYNRRKQIRGFGAIYAEGKIVDLLKEVIASYNLGLYYSTIALCGMIAERLCYDIIDFSEMWSDGRRIDEHEKKKYYNLQLIELIDFLFEIGIIDDKNNKLLHRIRKIRNSHVHPKMISDLKVDALEIFNLLCEVIENLFSQFIFHHTRDNKYLRKISYEDVVKNKGEFRRIQYFTIL